MIKGLMPRLAEGGKIKIGGLGESRPTKGGGTFRLPQKYDHFVVTKVTRNAAGDLEEDAALMAELVASGYADTDGKLRTIPIVLHSDDIDSVFPTSYAAYDGKSLLCRGDGETAERINRKTGEVSAMPCPCPWLRAKSGQVCKPHGTLHCSIRTPGRAVAGAVHRLRTTSIISCAEITGSLLNILELVGVLRGVPLVLRVGSREVAPDGKATTVHTLWIELRAADISAVQQQALQLATQRQAVRMAIGGEIDPDAVYRSMVRRPADGETPEEQAEIAAEFGLVNEPKALDAPVAKRADMFAVPDTPKRAVMRIGRQFGATDEMIAAIVNGAKADGVVPEDSDAWDDSHAQVIIDMLDLATREERE